jgi:hypothetical protein
VFIVRIWIEPREIPGQKPEWRGYIEHVASGERRSFRSLAEITRFIAPHLEQLGASAATPAWRRLLRRLNQLLGRKPRQPPDQPDD